MREKLIERSLTVKGMGRNPTLELAESTRKQYARAQARARVWLVSRGFSTVTPWTPETLAEYALDLRERGYSGATIDAALTAVRAGHRARGWPVPDGVAAWYVLRAGNNTGDDPAKVNTSGYRRAMLSEAARYMQVWRNAHARDLCLVALGWDLMCQVRDLLAVNLADVEVCQDVPGETYLRVRVRGQWQTVTHLHEPVDVCPVDATLLWMSRLRENGIRSGGLLRPVDQVGRIGGMPGWSGRGTAERLTIAGARFVWEQVIAGGQWRETSVAKMRTYAAVEAARAGQPVEWILRRGGWSSKGDVAFRLHEEAERAREEAGDGG